MAPCGLRKKQKKNGDVLATDNIKLDGVAPNPFEGVPPDPYVGSDEVVGLDSANVESYLKGVDIAMVMFYHRGEPQCDWSRKHFKKAAALTFRDGHQFAAIDCQQSTNFCVEEGVTSFPHFKIYTRGEDVGFSSDARRMVYQDMKTWVEGFPLGEKKMK